MTEEKVSEKLMKYNYLVGKKIAQDTIAAIVPIPIDSEMTVEQIVTMIFNNIPHNFFNSPNFRIIVMLNIEKFYDTGVVMWKNLDDILALLGIEDGN